MVKPVDPEIGLLKCLFQKVKEFNARNTYSPRGMHPRGLYYNNLHLFVADKSSYRNNYKRTFIKQAAMRDSTRTIEHKEPEAITNRC